MLIIDTIILYYNIGQNKIYKLPKLKKNDLVDIWLLTVAL